MDLKQSRPNDVISPDQDTATATEAAQTETAKSQPQSGWDYRPASELSSQTTSAVAPQTVSWTASEFIEHDKTNGWFMILGFVTLIVAALVYVLSRSVFTTGLVAVVAVLFGITAARKPRTLPYQIDNKGIHIGPRSYGYDTFKSFSVMHEGAINSIQLMPLKRFMPPLSLYFPPDQEQSITETLGSYLPYEPRSLDFVDRLMRQVRF